MQIEPPKRSRLVAQLAVTLLLYALIGCAIAWYFINAPCMNASPEEAPCQCCGEKATAAMGTLAEPIIQKLAAYHAEHGAYPPRLEDVDLATNHGNSAAPHWVYEPAEGGYALTYRCGLGMPTGRFAYDPGTGIWGRDGTTR